MTEERIVAVDVGLGTTDILIFQPGSPPENSVKLVIPSRTQIVAREIRAATASRRGVVFHGTVMGGGPCGGAMRDHVQAGLPFLATESAALTFADDLEKVAHRGVRLIGDDEVAGALDDGHVAVISGDLDLDALRDALTHLGAIAAFSGACVAVQDHGYSPAGSNRVLRFELWQRAIDERRTIVSLFYAPGEVPPVLTRLRAAVSALAGVPRVVAADTGPAALYGALPAGIGDAVLINVGNGHTLCVVARDGRLAGVFEHHTRRLDGASLSDYVSRFLAGLPLFVTGPRRALFAESGIEATYPAPFGDMMMTGPVGLLRAYGRRYGIDVPA